MHCKSHFLTFLFSFCMINSGSALCAHGSYLNLCGYCVGVTGVNNDVEGLDRCGVCDGQGSCVGCDGIINSPRRRDVCGLCLIPNTVQWNGCQKIGSIHPSTVDLALGDILIPLTLTGAGLNKSDMNFTQCVIIAMESQPDGPVVKDTSLEDNDLQIKVLLTQSTGKYRIGCSEIEGFAELLVVDSRDLNVARVTPSKMMIEENVELRIEVERSGKANANGKRWCFIRIHGVETRTLPAVRISQNKFICSRYVALVPGTFTVGLVASEDAAFNENGTGVTAELNVFGRPPKGEIAEYSPDMRRIQITFDQNIEVSDCKGVFSPRSEKSFGTGFSCTTIGDVFHVITRNDGEIVKYLEITEKNNIRRAVSSNAVHSPSAMPVTLPVSQDKVISPRIAVSAPNTVCIDVKKQPFVSVMASSLGGRKLSYTWSVSPMKGWRGRSQRENLLMWKSMRAVQTELNKIQSDRFLLNRTHLVPGLNYEISLRTENDLRTAMAITIQPAEKVSVTVTAFPSASAIIAEANIVFCSDIGNHSYRYKWTIDGKTVSEDGRLVVVRNVDPGIYNVSCFVMMHCSDLILGMGWTLTEIVKISRPMTIFPAEIVVGTMDDIVLRAYSTSGEANVRWTCTTPHNEPCIIAGPKAYDVTDILNITSFDLRIPAGTLPVGSYIWAIEDHNDVKASVIVSSKIPPRIQAVPLPPGVDPSKPVVVNAEIHRLKADCKLWWSTVYKKGYDFFNLQEDVGLGGLIRIKVDDLVTEEREAPLVIPAATGKWKGLKGLAMYLLRLEIVCPEPIPQAHLELSVVVNEPPRPPEIHVSPKTGEALNTTFTIQISEGVDLLEDYPLVHSLSYQDVPNQVVTIKSSIFPKFDVILPPGNITLIAKTCDLKNACSSSFTTVMVKHPSVINPELFENLGREVRDLMLSGDTAIAFGTATTAFKCLSSREKDRDKLDNITRITEAAVRERLQDLSRRLLYDSKLVKISLEFLEQSVMNLKFFPNSNDIVKDLMQFKNRVLKSSSSNRLKRAIDRDSAIVGNNDNLIRAIFELHWNNLKRNNSRSVKIRAADEISRFAFHLCLNDPRRGIVIDSSLVAVRIRKLLPSDARKKLPVADVESASLLLNDKFIKPKTCLITARYSSNLLADPVHIKRLSDIYEVRLIRDGRPERKNFVITLPAFNSTSSEKCMTWSNGWNPTCTTESKTEETVTCRCNELSFLSVFGSVNLTEVVQSSSEARNSEAAKSVVENDGIDNENLIKSVGHNKTQTFAISRLPSTSYSFRSISTPKTLSNNAPLSIFIQKRFSRQTDVKSSNVELKESTIKAIFDLQARNLEQNNTAQNREQLLNDTRTYMVEICNSLHGAVQDPVLIESSVVKLQVTKLTPNDLKREISMAKENDIRIKLNFKSFQRGICLATVKYRDDLIDDSTMRLSDTYEIRLIRNGTLTEILKENMKSMTVTLSVRVTRDQELTECVLWSKKGGWSSKCTVKTRTNSTITCTCKDTGVFSVIIPNKQPVTIASEISTAARTSMSATVVPTNPVTGTNSTVLLSTSTTLTTIRTIRTSIPVTVTTTLKNVTEENSELTAVLQNISNLRYKGPKSYISGTFRIDEDFKKTVGNNTSLFEKNMKNQIADQLNVSANVIASVIITPGSVIVTVLFVDTEETKAETAIKELVKKLSEGSLRLIVDNTTVLNVPCQQLRVKIRPNLSRSNGKMRLITYGMVAATFAAISLFALGATYFKRKRMPLQLPRLSIDDHPTYRQFHNEFSLEGSSASLARYRREHPSDKETAQ